MYVMNRKGTLITNKHTANQCKVTGHKFYTYHVILACSETLDDNKFIIDHLDIHQAITNIRVTGSCEEIQKRIYRAVRQVFATTETTLFFYRCILTPEADSVAYLEYIKLPPLPAGVKRPRELRYIVS